MKFALWLLTAAALLQAVLLFGGLLPARLCESWHAKGLFPLLRAAVGIPASLVPFSVAQLLLTLTALLALATAIELTLRAFGRVETLRIAPWMLLVLLLGVHGFLLGYGWLHARPPLADRFALGAPDDAAVASAARMLAASAREHDVPAARLPLDDHELELRAHEAVRQACAELGLAPPPPLRIKRPWPDRFLMRFGVSGVFAPFTFEPHVDGGLHPAQQAFVACHELAHVGGIASESEANFVAWLACTRSPDPRFRLAASLGVLGYFERDVPPELRPELHQLQGEAVRALRREIAERFRTAEWKTVARVSRGVYDGMLRAHGVESGIRSYGEVTRLVSTWLQRQGGD